VAATAAEVGRKPLERWLLDTPLVLYRTEAGDPVALDGRCPHRWAPLSAGYLEGDNIVCGYHGARFGKDGRCVRYPTQDTVPEIARVRSFPVIERGPFIWIWMGDDHVRQKTELPPELAWYLDKDWTCAGGYFTLNANYMLLHENVLDLTHFNYLHVDTLGFTNFPVLDYQHKGHSVGWEYNMTAADLPEDIAKLSGMSDPNILQSNASGWFLTPALHMVSGEVIRKPNPETPERVQDYICHILTPISPTRSHYWWIVGNSMPLPEEAREKARTMRATMNEKAFAQDKAMLESIQTMTQEDPRGQDYVEVSFKGDVGGLRARVALARILAAERKQAVAEAAAAR
jgi:vanillate O-demethylase monooxygenase subunit